MWEGRKGRREGRGEVRRIRRGEGRRGGDLKRRGEEGCGVREGMKERREEGRVILIIICDNNEGGGEDCYITR